MEVITIVPKNLVGYTEKQPMHMALAQFFPEACMVDYYEHFRKATAKGQYVIMDNGAAETGCCSIDQLIRAAQFVGAQEVVVPDVLKGVDKTLEYACEYIPQIRERMPDVKIMTVAQGETLDEWYECAVELLKMDIDVLGVPKVLTKIGGPNARAEVLTRLAGLTRGVEVHLLGCNESPLEAKAIENLMRQDKMFPRVRSIDSALPYVYAMNNIRIVDGPRPSGTIDFRNGSLNADQIRLLERNIEIWQHDCNLHDDNHNVVKLF